MSNRQKLSKQVQNTGGKWRRTGHYGAHLRPCQQPCSSLSVRASKNTQEGYKKKKKKRKWCCRLVLGTASDFHVWILSPSLFHSLSLLPLLALNPGDNESPPGSVSFNMTHKMHLGCILSVILWLLSLSKLNQNLIVFFFLQHF